MRNLLLALALGVAAAACHPTHKGDEPPAEPTGTSTTGGTPEQPSEPPAPAPTPQEPNTPAPEPAPAPVPQEPNVAPLPKPTTDPAELDVPAAAFDKVTFQVSAKKPKKFGLFVNDPNGKYGHSFFIVPDLQFSKGQLSLKVGENEYQVGMTNACGVANARTALCRKNYGENCSVVVKTLANVMTELVFTFPSGEIVAYTGNDDF